MPRLVGRQSNSGASVVLSLLIAIGVASALEYEGVIDVAPDFGKSFVEDKSLNDQNPVASPSISGSGASGAVDPSLDQPANQPINSQPSPSPSLAQ